MLLVERELEAVPEQQIVRIPWWKKPWGIALLTVAGLISCVAIYGAVRLHRFFKVVDERIAQGVFSTSANLYAAPVELRAQDEYTPGEIEALLRRSGYGPQGTEPMGSYKLSKDKLDILPGSSATIAQTPIRITFKDKQIQSIVSLQDGSVIERAFLEPELVTNFTQGREKRRLVKFSDVPPTLVHAVTSVEDKRFFQHPGFDAPRILRAAYLDYRDGRKGQGASTLTMQLARNLWLDPKKTWRRKVQELLISMRLEQKWTKEQIFTAYCNQIYLGRHNTFNIHGFGEGAHVYFNKDISDLNQDEAAMLAGLVQRPSYFNPFRYPERARERRNIVLLLMRQNGYLSNSEYAQHIADPIELAATPTHAEDAPYFFALANEELNSAMPEETSAREMYRVRTTLDRPLQHAAEEAVRISMVNVDKALVRIHHNDETPAQAQVALIALDPHTGEIKALVGGRDYRVSQLNHAISKRQPGSVFKPLVYAAALRAGYDSKGKEITPYTGVVDAPTTFHFDRQEYQPGNFHNTFRGWVTLKAALAHSMNIPAVKTAEMIGYGTVVQMAREAGLNDAIQPTPAIALGAYEATPLEMAGAYTIFANEGMYVKPTFISRVEGMHGETLFGHNGQQRRVLPPQTYYDILDMMQEVVRSGTAAGLNPTLKKLVAAKTGTSRDGWFAGFTSDLLCVVWIGYDDHRELGLEGSKSAMLVWQEFMKTAVAKETGAKPFEIPQAYHRTPPPPKDDDENDPLRQAGMPQGSDPELVQPRVVNVEK